MKRNYGDGNMNIELMQSRSFLEKNKKGIPGQKVSGSCGETSKVVVEERQVNRSGVRSSPDCRRAVNTHVNEHLDV